MGTINDSLIKFVVIIGKYQDDGFYRDIGSGTPGSLLEVIVKLVNLSMKPQSGNYMKKLGQRTFP